MIENGHRGVERRPLLAALAHALQVSVPDLVGQPYLPTERVDLDSYMTVPDVRAALDCVDPTPPRPIQQLTFAADRAMAARMACDWPAFRAHLPDVLAESQILFGETGSTEAGRLLVKAAVTAALMVKPAGWVDLAVRLAELAERTAERIGDPVSAAAARFALAQCALAVGNQRRSYTLADTAAGELAWAMDQLPPALVEDGVALRGMLHLHAALSAACLHRPQDVVAHLDEAERLANQVQGDPWRMELSPANVGTWRVGIALEMGEPDRVPGLARQVNPAQLRTPQRRARLYLDTGRALFYTGDTEAAVKALLAADNVAPGDLRNRPTAVDVVHQMVRQVPTRGGSAPLRELAVRVGVDPEAALAA